MLSLSIQNVSVQKQGLIEKAKSLPIKVLQVGEGNFLRGFADWMLHKAIEQGVFDGSVVVTQPRASGKHKIDELKAQDGLYTLVTRGIADGKLVEQVELISVFSKILNPYEQWQSFLNLAKEPELRFVISNTTEAGLVYIAEERYTLNTPITSFAGKLTALLYERYQYFGGDTAKGFICLPCELLEKNGDTLKQLVIRYANDWALPASFISWITHHNYFLNSLVDRIVTGYPTEEQAQKWFSDWAYSDKQVTTAEPYHLWAIEADKKLAEQLPLAQAGLNVIWVDNLKQYQQRKVAILNGAHTSLALLALLYGEQEVRLAMENETLSHLVKSLVEKEIIPTLPYAASELLNYAEEVYERFQNPFIQHRLHDIAMNSLSKFKTRLMPAMLFHLEKDGQLPLNLLTICAALLRHYRVNKDGEHFISTTFAGDVLLIRDDYHLLQQVYEVWLAYDEHKDCRLAVSNLLQIEAWWGSNLAKQYPKLIDQLNQKLTEMEWV